MTTEDDLTTWFRARLPTIRGRGCEVTADADEILVVVDLQTDDDPQAAIARWRERTRDGRMRMANEAEGRFGRKVSWGATCSGTRALFTHLSLPVMTRLRLAERGVLDTLIDAGIARSRSDALAWCVRLVGKHEQEWLQDLRAAFKEVERVRARGPRSG